MLSLQDVVIKRVGDQVHIWTNHCKIEGSLFLNCEGVAIETSQDNHFKTDAPIVIHTNKRK